jgi:2-polyprenyl-3-methyl-5-hydroxy-6-metoxy-1,4-benzoquinol methylase
MKLETDQDTIQFINGAKAIAVVSAWNALGLFEQMRSGPLLREALKANPRAVASTLPVLLHLGLVAADGERVGLTPRGERLMAQRAMPTDRNLVVLRDLSKMVEVLRDGGPVRDDQGKSKATAGGTLADNVEHTERFLDMLYGMSEEAARSTFTWLAPGMPKHATVLDLGGGHGRYARVFADAGHSVTLFDQSVVVGLAKKRHGDALHYLEGDFHKVESFGGPYDLVLLCNVVHGEAAEANASIVARAARSLRSGGRMAIRDMFLDEHQQNPSSAAFFGMTMLFYTEQGTSPTVRQAEDWLSRAGLKDMQMTVLETHQMVTARKP